MWGIEYGWILIRPIAFWSLIAMWAVLWSLAGYLWGTRGK